MKLNHHLDCSLCVCVCGWGQRHHTTMHDHMLMFVVVGGVYWWCVVNSVDHLARFVKVSVEHQVSPSSLLFSLKISKSLAKNWQRITHSLWEGSIRRRRREKRKKHVIFTTTNDTYMMSTMKLRPTCWHTMLTLQTSFCVTLSCSYPIGDVWKYTRCFFCCRWEGTEEAHFTNPFFTTRWPPSVKVPSMWSVGGTEGGKSTIHMYLSHLLTICPVQCPTVKKSKFSKHHSPLLTHIHTIQYWHAEHEYDLCFDVLLTGCCELLPCVGSE